MIFIYKLPYKDTQDASDSYKTYRKVRSWLSNNIGAEINDNRVNMPRLTNPNDQGFVVWDAAFNRYMHLRSSVESTIPVMHACLSAVGEEWQVHLGILSDGAPELLIEVPTDSIAVQLRLSCL
jgi:hypothetical protein